MLKQYSKNIAETSTAIFIIAAVLLFILANFMVGFSLPIWAFTMLFGFALSLIFPRAGTYAIVFLTVVFERFFTLAPIYLNREEIKIYPLDIIFIGVILGTAAQILANVLKRRQNNSNSGYLGTKLNTVDYLVGLFILASVAYFFFSAYLLHADYSIAFSTMKNYSFYGLFYFVIRFMFRDREKLMELLKFFLAGALAIIIFILIGIIRGEGLWTEFTPLSTEGTRILAFPHAFFLSMAVLVSFVWLAISEKMDSFRTWLIILVPVWTIGVLGSLMRHLWISIFISLMFLLWILSKEERKRLNKILLHYIFAGIISAAILAYLAFIFPDSSLSKTVAGVAGITGQRFVSTAQISSDESLNWRKSVWQSTWQEYKNNLVFGLGFGKKVSVEIGTDYKDFVEIRNIHNSLLTIFIQMGLWSVALFAALFWLVAKPSIKKSGNAESPESRFMRVALLVIFVNYLIAFLFQTYLETNLLGIFFWMILGGLAAIGSIEYKESVN